MCCASAILVAFTTPSRGGGANANADEKYLCKHQMTDYQRLASQALCEPDPDAKCRLITALHQQLETAKAPGTLSRQVDIIDLPGVPERPQLVHPRQLKKRGSGTEQGRVALLHAIAHIEFNAMNLALDAAVRFAGLPKEYYRDWIGVAADEARHYALLSGRLADFDACYGDFPAHQGLWDMALRTAHDPLDRMAMVPRMLEARGLDVTPAMVLQFERAGDTATAHILRLILEEEVAHVEAGTRWFRYLCDVRGLDSDAAWFGLVSDYMGTDIRCPINIEDRNRAGFRQTELDWLKQACRNKAINQ